jgi:hypothetical protein
MKFNIEIPTQGLLRAPWAADTSWLRRCRAGSTDLRAEPAYSRAHGLSLGNIYVKLIEYGNN